MPLKPKSAYLKSYGYYGIARHPFPSTPGKHHGYKKTREMFLAASKYFDIPVERVAIPLPGQSHRRPFATAEKLPAPMIMHWGGIDNWKEERHSFGENFVKEGWGCFIIDSPGTGECPHARRTRTRIKSTRPCWNICSNGPRSTQQDRRRRRQLRRPLVDQAGPPGAGQTARRGQLGRRHSLFLSTRMAGAIAPRRLLSFRSDRSTRQFIRQENFDELCRSCRRCRCSTRAGSTNPARRC